MEILKSSIKLTVMIFFILCVYIPVKSEADEEGKKTVTFVPGAAIYKVLRLKDIWSDVDYDKHIYQFQQSAPEGIYLSKSLVNLTIYWNPTHSLAGNTYPLGSYQLKVASMEPMSFEVHNNIVTISDNCFSYKGNKSGEFSFTLKGINSDGIDKYKEIRFYKVTSKINEKLMFSKIRWKRLSCFFTANRPAFNYKLDGKEISSILNFPVIENIYKNQTLFTRAKFPATTDVGGIPEEEKERWTEVGVKNVVNKNTSHGYQENLFFIGTYTSF